MASTSGGGHGGKRRNSDRKRTISDLKKCKKDWFKTHKRICLKDRIFQSWLRVKFEAGYEACSDSEFAAHLLLLEYRRR